MRFLKIKSFHQKSRRQVFFDYFSGSLWEYPTPTVEPPRERAFGMVFMDQRGSWYSQLLAPPDRYVMPKVWSSNPRPVANKGWELGFPLRKHVIGIN